LLTTSVHQTTQGLAMLASSDSSQSQIAMQPTFSEGNVTGYQVFFFYSLSFPLNKSIYEVISINFC